MTIDQYIDKFLAEDLSFQITIQSGEVSIHFFTPEGLKRVDADSTLAALHKMDEVMECYR